MESIWRKHLIICLFLGLLAVPIYFLDLKYTTPGRPSGNWITLDFRGVIFRAYLVLLAIHVALSSITVLSFRRLGALPIHFGSMLLSMILFVAAFVISAKLHQRAISNQFRTLMESRRPRINVIELKAWSYFPDEIDPTEIRVSVHVHEAAGSQAM